MCAYPISSEDLSKTSESCRALMLDQITHHLLVFRMKTKSKFTVSEPVESYNTALLKDKTKQNEFRDTLNNRFQALEKLTEDETVEEQWKEIKEAITSSCQQVLSP